MKFGKTKRTLIYRQWYAFESAVPGKPKEARSRECVVTTGEDGVEEFYSRSDGMVEIRMSDPDADEYWVPSHQVLALITESE